jgi:hypothetical protein
VPHPTFCDQHCLDIQDRGSYSSTMNKQCLIKKHERQNYPRSEICLGGNSELVHRCHATAIARTILLTRKRRANTVFFNISEIDKCFNPMVVPRHGMHTDGVE